MTRTQLDHAVAGLTGESLRQVRRLGFQLHAGPRADLEPEDVALCLDCPFCGRLVAPEPAPAPAPAGARLAECRRCDVEFTYSDRDIYPAPAAPAPATLADRAWRALAARRSTAARTVEAAATS